MACCTRAIRSGHQSYPGGMSKHALGAMEGAIPSIRRAHPYSLVQQAQLSPIACSRSHAQTSASWPLCQHQSCRTQPPPTQLVDPRCKRPRGPATAFQLCVHCTRLRARTRRFRPLLSSEVLGLHQFLFTPRLSLSDSYNEPIVCPRALPALPNVLVQKGVHTGLASGRTDFDFLDLG
jgi:hypothetical protein